jgi:hypothetical protein
MLVRSRTRFWKSPLLTLCLAHSLCVADELSSRISSLETRMSAIKIETAQGTIGAQMASASPQFDGYGLFITADLLYWHLYEGGTDFAVSQKITGPRNFPNVSGKSTHLRFDWDFGFRLGGGYHFEHDAWDAYVNFTWFQTDASRHVSSPGDLSLQKGAINTLLASEIRGHWDVHNYVIDLEVGRRFFVSKFLSFRPQFGIETAWIFQRRHFSMKKPFDIITQSTSDSIHGKCHDWGIGPRAGVEGTWFFTTHFSVFGSINGALLWSHFETKNKENVGIPFGEITGVEVRDAFHRLVPNVQMATGFSWDSNLSEDRFHLGIKLGYEFQYWWRQNQFLNEQQSLFYGLQHESNDMSINGVTFDVRFDF